MADRRWALLVGAREYEFYRPLKYSAADAADFASELTKHLGFTRDTMMLLTDEPKQQPDAPPTRSKLFHSLGLLSNPDSEHYVKKHIQPIGEDDLFVFYFSGHGLNSADGEEFLLLTDASDQQIADTSVNIGELVKLIGNLPCRHKILFIDACRAEFDEDDGAKAAGSAKGIGTWQPDREGLATFYSCDPKDRSYEIDALGHGSFTHCLIEAVTDREVVTLDDLAKHLASRVPVLNVEKGKDIQQPFFVPNPADMAALPLFAIQEKVKTVDVDDLLQQASDLHAEGVIDFEWWDKIFSFQAELKDGTATNPSIRRSILKRFLRRDMTLADFEARWMSTEKPTPSVRETKPQVRPGGDTSLLPSDS